MAVDLIIHLTDDEQAVVQDLAQRYDSGLSLAQVKTWAETQGKKGLWQAVMQLWQEVDLAEATAEAVARQERAAQALLNFPDPTGG